jgi:hypothetical protein
MRCNLIHRRRSSRIPSLTPLPSDRATFRPRVTRPQRLTVGLARVVRPEAGQHLLIHDAGNLKALVARPSGASDVTKLVRLVLSSRSRKAARATRRVSSGGAVESSGWSDIDRLTGVTGRILNTLNQDHAPHCAGKRLRHQCHHLLYRLLHVPWNMISYRTC